MSKKEVSRGYEGSFPAHPQDNFGQKVIVATFPEAIILIRLYTDEKTFLGYKEVLDYVIYDRQVLIRFPQGKLIVDIGPEGEGLHPDFQEFLENAAWLGR